MASLATDEPYFDLLSRKWVERLEKAIVVDTGVTPKDIVGFERFEEDLTEFFQFAERAADGNIAAGGTLLYGPRGARKTFLAKALATQCKATFIWTHASDFLASWIGLTEKSVTSLFKVARQRRPSVIFIDDIDLLCRDTSQIESEQIRRVKAQFLRQIQRVENRGTYLLASTSQPWKLDPILRQRFTKRIFVPLPNLDERAKVFRAQFSGEVNHQLKESDWLALAERTDSYSSAEIVAVCREALMRPVHRLVSSTHFQRIPNPNATGPAEVWTCCSTDDDGAVEMLIDMIAADQLCEPPVSMEEILHELETRPTKFNAEDLQMQLTFRKEFGENLL